MPTALHLTIAQLRARRSFSESEAAEVITTLMRGESLMEEMAALLTLWKDKGVTVDELVGAARAMRALATPITIRPGLVADTCGTGGDGLNTFNVSTVAALIVAGAGVRVAKHGNRGATSRCGSADLFEALGVVINPGPEVVARCLDEIGIGFLFAPQFHPAMKHVATVRKQLPFRTIFNLLGPLTNPAKVTHQLVGVSDKGVVGVMAEALLRLGVQRAWVVYGEDGLDEVSLSSPTRLVEVAAGRVVEKMFIDPDECGVAPSPLETIKGGDTQTCAGIAEGVLRGDPGPYLEAAVLNAGCALHVAGAAPSIATGVTLARRVIGRGEASRKLDALRAMTRPR